LTIVFILVESLLMILHLNHHRMRNSRPMYNAPQRYKRPIDIPPPNSKVYPPETHD
jgi:hypothetical protein